MNAPMWQRKRCLIQVIGIEGENSHLMGTSVVKDGSVRLRTQPRIIHSSSIEPFSRQGGEDLARQVREPFALLPRLKNAGEVLIGPYTPFCTGNYCVGTNACLSTGGFADAFFCTTVYDFLKRTGMAYVTAEGYGSFHIPHYRFRLLHYGLEKLTASWRLAPPIA